MADNIKHRTFHTRSNQYEFGSSKLEDTQSNPVIQEAFQPSDADQISHNRRVSMKRRTGSVKQKYSPLSPKLSREKFKLKLFSIRNQPDETSSLYGILDDDDLYEDALSPSENKTLTERMGFPKLQFKSNWKKARDEMTAGVKKIFRETKSIPKNFIQNMDVMMNKKSRQHIEIGRPTIHHDFSTYKPNHKAIGDLYITVIGAKNIILGDSLAYCEISLGNCKKLTKKRNDLLWNETFLFDVLSESAMLKIELYYCNPILENTQGELVGVVTFLLSDFKQGQTSDCWYNLNSAKGEKLPCSIHLSMQFRKREKKQPREHGKNLEYYIEALDQFFESLGPSASIIWKKKVSDSLGFGDNINDDEIKKKVERWMKNRKQLSPKQQLKEAEIQKESDEAEIKQDVGNIYSSPRCIIEEFSESKIDTKELLNVVSKLTTKNQLLEKNIQLLHEQIEIMNEKFSELKTQQIEYNEKLARLGSQIEDIHKTTRILDQEMIVQKEDVTESTHKIKNLEEHIDQLRSQQSRSITEYLFILLAYVLRGLGFILVVVSAVFTYMKLTKKTQQKGSKSGSFTNEIEEKLKQKRESIQLLSKRFEEQAHSRFIPVAKTYAEKKKIYEANQKAHKKTMSALSNTTTITNMSVLSNRQSTTSGGDHSKLKNSKQEEENIKSKNQFNSDSESEDGFYDIIEQTNSSPSHEDHDEYYKDFEQNMINEAQQIQRMSTLLHESPKLTNTLNHQKYGLSPINLQSNIPPKPETPASNLSIIKYEQDSSAEDWLDDNEFGSYELLQKRSRLNDVK